VVINQLHVPIGRQVVIQLSSKDVIHSLGIPAMRIKQDAIPGVMATVWFTPILAGQFDIACSQLCGLGHYRMRGILTVESEDAFRQWLAQQAALQ
jgi:cytochrome c oxidase subunit II